MDGAMRIAQFQCMHHKNKFQRPRPTQLSPNLLPPVDVPTHSAFPSAHATEAWTLAFCVQEVMDRAAASLGDPIPSLLGNLPLHRMAERITRNREVLGLHYPSDGVAGKTLAGETFRIMKTCTLANRLINQAAIEWNEYKTAPPS